MKKAILEFFLCVTGVQISRAWASLPNSTTTSPTKSEEEILQLSKQKWQWMADKNVDSLGTLFDEKAVFVPMGGNWGKDRKSIRSEAGASGTRKPKYMGLP